MERNGNNLIKSLVIIFDFVIFNLILLTFIKLVPSSIPQYIVEHTKLTFLLLNFALILSQSRFSTILHIRSTKVKDTFLQSSKLVYSQALLMFLSIRLMANTGRLFEFMIAYSLSCHVVVVCARLAEHYILKYYRRSGGNITKVVFVGSDFANAEIYNNLMNDMSTGYRVIGYFADGEISGVNSSFIHLGTMADLNRHMNESLQVAEHDKSKLSCEIDNSANTGNKDFQLSGVDEIFCCLSHDEDVEIRRIMNFCDKNVIHFYYVPRQFGNYQLGLMPETIGSFNLYTNHKEPLLEIQNYTAKRTFDIVFSLIVMAVVLPFFPIIALIIKIQSPGPLFFKQERTGADGKVFLCYKFRSMHVNANADEQQATKNDPRKYPFGSFMRKTNIDELPQFYNVLKGDMSVVGPRPHMLKHTEMYSEIIDKYMVRHFCKPGITGLAQISGFRGETKEVWQMEERIKKDLWYIENWTFWLDIKIILRTAISIIIPDKNAY